MKVARWVIGLVLATLVAVALWLWVQLGEVDDEEVKE